MSLFGNLKTEGLEEAQDRLGGFSPLETNMYEAEIKVAYAGESTNGAMSVTLLADIDGREYRETVYVTNRNKENFFLNQSDKSKKVPLPGFTVIEDLCLVTTDKPLAEQASEEKMVKIYDPDLKAEAPKSVPVLTELTGKKVFLGIVQQLENKNEKQGDKYVPTAETRVSNYIEKIFHFPTKLTTVEAKNGGTPETAAFADKWVEKNKGVQRDKRTVKGDGAPGRPARGGDSGPPQASGSAGSSAPRTSLFGAKS